MRCTETGRFTRARRPLDRFAEKCAFDPVTGCVMWVGGTSSGRGHKEPYGQFWDDGRVWWAHRWSAARIHGHNIDGLQVDHCCPHGPSTLCVEHIKPERAEVNRELQHSRPGRALQTLETRRFWIHVQVGLQRYDPPEREDLDMPFYYPPAWLAPYL